MSTSDFLRNSCSQLEAWKRIVHFNSPGKGNKQVEMSFNSFRKENLVQHLNLFLSQLIKWAGTNITTVILWRLLTTASTAHYLWHLRNQLANGTLAKVSFKVHDMKILVKYWQNLPPEMCITNETKWHQLCCCYDNNFSTGPVLIKTELPSFCLNQGPFTLASLMVRVMVTMSVPSRTSCPT